MVHTLGKRHRNTIIFTKLFKINLGLGFFYPSLKYYTFSETVRRKQDTTDNVFVVFMIGLSATEHIATLFHIID